MHEAATADVRFDVDGVRINAVPIGVPLTESSHNDAFKRYVALGAHRWASPDRTRAAFLIGALWMVRVWSGTCSDGQLELDRPHALVPDEPRMYEQRLASYVFDERVDALCRRQPLLLAVERR